MADAETREEGSFHWKKKGNGNGNQMPSIFNPPGGGKDKEARFATREDVKDAYYWCRDEFNTRLADQQMSVIKALRGATVAKWIGIFGGGGAFLSLLLSGSGLIDSYYRPPAIAASYSQHEERTRLTYLAVSNSVHQLDQQIAMLIAEKKQNDHEANLERFEDNDKFGALLKAVDALKAQVGEMQWYVNDDTREIMSDLRKHLEKLDQRKNEE